MAKKHADKIDPAAKPRAPRRVPKRAGAAAPADVAARATSTEQRAEASDMTSSALTSDTPAEVTAADRPSYDDIARAAYDRYLSRGASHGRDFDDWLDAERELRKK